MKQIARIALVAVLLIGGMVRAGWCQEDAEQYWRELNVKAATAYEQDKHQQGIIIAEEAYVYALKHFTQEHPYILKSINSLYVMYLNQGLYNKAESMVKKSINIAEKKFGSEDTYTLILMNNLAGVYLNQGRHNEAESIFKKVLDLRKKILGDEHLKTLSSMNNLAGVYLNQGRHNEAEPIFKKVLELRKKMLGDEHLDTLSSMNDLATLYRIQGRDNEADPIFREVVKVKEERYGKEALTTLDAIRNLAEFYKQQRKYREAETPYKEVLGIRKKVLGIKHRKTLESAYDLAELYVSQKKYSEAEVILKNNLYSCEQVLGKRNVTTPKFLHELGFIYKKYGRYREAESLVKEAFELREEVQGATHPWTLVSMDLYISLLIVTHRFQIALPLIKELENRLFLHSAQELYTSSSHNVRRLYEKRMNSFWNIVYSLAFHQPGKTYQQYAADVILRWKQLYAEEEAFQHQQLANSNAPEIVKLRNNLAGARIKLSQALLQKKNEEELASLMDDYNEAETALLAEAKRFKSNLEVEKVTLDRVLSVLPQNSGLIEYRLFQPVDFKTGKGGKPHLAALLLLADPKAKQRFLFRDLGPLAEIEKHLKKETAEAYKRLIAPFDDQISGLKQLYIAPDGPLSLLSFASLRLPDGRFLAERQQINRLQTGRDLIENGKDFPRGKGLVAVGGAKYGSMPAGKAEPAPTLAAYQQRAARELGEGIAYLPESRREAQTIGEIFTSNTGEKPTVLIGDEASEHSLKQLRQPPRILHLSTHGFYLAQEEQSRLAEEAPLLLSGLALAGANNGLQGKLDQHGDDGLLYSLEVLGLNLHGTELVSLSACDTGKGVVDYSEGVYGLVRAFRTAGAKNVLMTLTPVGDTSSRDFMETFYDKWLSSEQNISPAEALHQTRLQFIRDKKPVQDWAPFVLVGK